MLDYVMDAPESPDEALDTMRESPDDNMSWIARVAGFVRIVRLVDRDGLLCEMRDYIDS